MATNSNQLDPIAYRQEEQGPITETTKNWQFDPAKLQNADINLSAYGDDSSAVNYNNSALRGGENTKYRGENTKNTSVAYNPNATISGLNPNYAYGQKAQMVNSSDAGYIQRRNDEIASALYNEGKVSQEDVRNYLMQQEGFTNSEANERENTIQSVWKRLGQIQADQSKKEQPTEEKKPIDESALVEDTSGKIYGKVTPETGKPSEGITTLADENNVYTKMQEARVANVNALRSMDPAAAAALAHSGTTPYGETTMRDIQSLDPDWYKQYSTELKKLYTQDSVDKITMGDEGEESKTFVDSNDEQIDNDIKTWDEENVNSDNEDYATGYLEKKLKSNQVATSTKQEMLNIKKDISDLNSALEDLPNQAEKIFKGDVPEYLVQAYISNNSQKLQKKIQNLENRYSSLSDMYKTEVSQAQREAEFYLKQQEFQRNITNDSFDQMIKKANLELNSIHWGSDGQGNIVGFKYNPSTGGMIKVSDETAFASYQTNVNAINGMAREYIGKNTGKQCIGFTNMLTNKSAGVQMLGYNADGTTNTNPSLAERIEYATNPNVSDKIPIPGDIGIMVSNGSNGVSPTRGHTVYVDNVYQDDNGNTWIHYIATNTGKDGEETLAYQKDVTLNQFYENGGVGFWNPYKQAQYNSKPSEIGIGAEENKMELVIDQKIDSGKLNATQLSNLSAFGRTYENLWRSKNNGELYELLNEHEAARFLQELSISLTNPNSGQAINSSVESLGKISLDEFMKQLESKAAQEFGGGSKAYMGFMAIVGVIESKLRKESGAAISGSERAMEFKQYLPEAADDEYTMNEKLERLETFLKYWAKEGGITKNEYIPLNLGNISKERSYD